jgi:hypothetical protein
MYLSIYAYMYIYEYIYIYVSIYYICQLYDALVQQGIVSESQKADLLQRYMCMYIHI